MLAIKQCMMPRTLTEATELLARNRLRVVAGGTDVVPLLRDGRLHDTDFLKLNRLQEELGGITLTEGYLRIGALAQHRDIYENELIRDNLMPLAKACGMIGSTQIRNRGTIGGNIVNASPAADSLPVLVAAGAEVELVSAKGTRKMPVGEFVVGPGKTGLRPDELLTAVIVPLPTGGWKGDYEKVGSRNALIISVAGVAILFSGECGWRIALGSVAPTVVRAPGVECLFAADEAVTKETMYQELEKAISPIDDVRASAMYRTKTLANLLYHAYEQRGRWMQDE